MFIQECNWSYLCTRFGDFFGKYRFELPKSEYIFSTLNGGTCFAKIDLSDAFLLIEVYEDSNELLTVNTNMGIFRNKLLTFGIKSTPDFCKEVMDAMLTCLTGIAAFIEAINIAREIQDDPLNRLFSVFERIQQYGFRFPAEECQFFRTSIKYLRFIFDENG